MAPGQMDQRFKGGVEHRLDALAAKRLVSAVTQKLQRRAIGAADVACFIKCQHPLAGCAHEFGATVKAQHPEFAAGLKQSAVLDVLRSEIHERERVCLRARGGAGDVECREQLSLHVKYWRGGARELRVLHEKVIAAMNDDGP